MPQVDKLLASWNKYQLKQRLNRESSGQNKLTVSSIDSRLVQSLIEQEKQRLGLPLDTMCSFSLEFHTNTPAPAPAPAPTETPDETFVFKPDPKYFTRNRGVHGNQGANKDSGQRISSTGAIQKVGNPGGGSSLRNDRRRGEPERGGYHGGYKSYRGGSRAGSGADARDEAQEDLESLGGSDDELLARPGPLYEGHMYATVDGAKTERKMNLEDESPGGQTS